MRRVRVKRIGDKVYAVCHGCGKIVRVNKPIFGGLHICLLREEQELYRAELSQAVKQSQAELESW